MSIQRRTIRRPIKLAGTGLFSAQSASLSISPSSDCDGILFDVDGQRFPADIHHLSSKPVHPAFQDLSARCTSVAADEGRSNNAVATIEHLMSALIGTGITDAIIETDAPEIPILDGSALPFVQAILDAGIETLDGTIEPIVVSKTIEIRKNDASIIIIPAESASYSYTIDYGTDSPIAAASVSWMNDPDDYKDTIAAARTFCLAHEAEQMHNAGLFKHLSTEDMLVIGEDGPVGTPYRCADECANHKLLDLIGDLALVGRPLLAEVRAHKSGHAMAHEAARAIVDLCT